MPALGCGLRVTPLAVVGRLRAMIPIIAMLVSTRGTMGIAALWPASFPRLLPVPLTSAASMTASLPADTMTAAFPAVTLTAAVAAATMTMIDPTTMAASLPAASTAVIDQWAANALRDGRWCRCDGRIGVDIRMEIHPLMDFLQ